MMTTKPERVAPTELDEAVKEGVERAEQTNELTKDDLDNAAGGIWKIPTAGAVPVNDVM
jgi:hypothetical protein